MCSWYEKKQRAGHSWELILPYYSPQMSVMKHSDCLQSEEATWELDHLISAWGIFKCGKKDEFTSSKKHSFPRVLQRKYEREGILFSYNYTVQKSCILNILSWKRALPASMILSPLIREALGTGIEQKFLVDLYPLQSQELESKSSRYRLVFWVQLSINLRVCQRFCCGKRSQTPGKNSIFCCKMACAATIK